MSHTKKQSLLQVVLWVGIVIAVNMLAHQVYTFFDLTEEKRYTLTNPTRELLSGLENPVTVEVLLDGDFPAGFKRLQNAVREILTDFSAESTEFEFLFTDPSEGSAEQINETRRILSEQGITPVNLRLPGSGEMVEKLIYPYAIFRFADRMIAVNILENERLGASPELVLNSSISLLEYKFANAIQKLLLPPLNRPLIGLTTGRGELPEAVTQDFEKSLSPFYNSLRVDLDMVIRLPVDTIPLLIVAKPQAPFSDKVKFVLDQYVMNGGKIIWLIDKLDVSLDSLARSGEYIPVERDLNLDDLLFRYGVRIQPNMVLDLECSPIPQRVGTVGDRPQIDLFPWYYHPIVSPTSGHPVAKGLDRINLFFPSRIDTVKAPGDVRSTVLLSSSAYSREQFVGSRLNFEILRYEPDASQFNRGRQALAVFLDGDFESLYKNRVPPEMMDGMKRVNIEFLERSVPTQMMVVADGDIIRNLRDPRSGASLPLGYNRYDRYTYANKDFLLNAVEYMLDDLGVFEARAKEVKLRLLDTVRAREEATFWRLVNIALPVALLAIFGFLWQWRRRSIYGKPGLS
jgi:ABC-2 type transport system permease protein